MKPMFRILIFKKILKLQDRYRKIYNNFPLKTSSYLSR